MRILYGEGDRFGCWLDVAAEAIVWHPLGGPDSDSVIQARPPTQPSVATSPTRAADAGADAAAGDLFVIGEYGAAQVQVRLVEHSGAGGGLGGPLLVDMDSIRPLGGVAGGRATRSMRARLSTVFGHATALHRSMRERVLTQHSKFRRGGRLGVAGVLER